MSRIGTFWVRLRSFGPGAILASTSIGAGETILALHTGAWSSYGFLWVVLLSVLIKAFVITYLVGRYSVLSGESIMSGLATLPGPRAWLPGVVIFFEMIGAPFAWVAIAKPSGLLFHEALRGYVAIGVSAGHLTNGISSLFLLSALAVGLVSSYHKLRRYQVAICWTLVVGMVAGTIIVGPSIVEAARGAVSFGKIPEMPAWAPESVAERPWLYIATFFGYVGASGLAYLAYSGFVLEQGWCSRAASEKEVHLSALRWDVLIGGAVMFVVTGAFLVAGATILYPLAVRAQQWDYLLAHQYVWAAIHPSLVWILSICVILALWGTLHAMPLIYLNAIGSFLEQTKFGNLDLRRQIKGALGVYLSGMTMVLLWKDVSFEILTRVVAFVVVNLSLSLILISVLWLNIGRLRSPVGLWLRLAGIAAACVVIVSAVLSGAGLLQDLLA